MERKIYLNRDPCKDINELKSRIKAAWNELPVTLCRSWITEFPKRVRACINAQGGHIESEFNI